MIVFTNTEDTANSFIKIGEDQIGQLMSVIQGGGRRIARPGLHSKFWTGQDCIARPWGGGQGGGSGAGETAWGQVQWYSAHVSPAF